MIVEFHPEAIEESRAAWAWYEARSEAASAGFVEELDLAAQRIGEAPHRAREYLHGTRRYLLRRFPFSVVYRAKDEIVTVVAVAHHRRRPGYWRQRER